MPLSVARRTVLCFALVAVFVLPGGTSRAAQSDDFAGRRGLVASDVSQATVERAESEARRDFEALPALPPVAAGSSKTFHLIAEAKMWSPAPGVSTEAWTYNGTVPGPTLHVREGDRVRIILTNHLPEPTTIHWHGVSLPQDMDGVPGLSQKAVPPRQTFVYEFVAKSPGTYFYHTHFDDLNQIDRGLYGAFVVDPKIPDSIRYNRDYLMMLSSWRIYSGTENYFSIDGKSYPLTKPFVVKPGEMVRIREINISGTEFHTMHVHGHRFVLVAVDGQPVAPANRQAMVTVLLGPGESRDVAFRADAQPGTWMVHCHVADHMMNGGTGPGGLVSAIQYEGAHDKLAALAQQNVMAMGPGGGKAGGDSGPKGPPLGKSATWILGAIAGLTIFFGLPIAVLRRVSPQGVAFLNAVAIGILFFLLFDILRQAGEPVGQALDAMRQGSGGLTFAGLTATYVGGLLVGLVGLVYFSRMVAQRGASLAGGVLAPVALATSIAVGIGLHNFSEGLAIGQSAATGAVQLALLLIVGFGLHNMTEGFGIAAPLAGTGQTSLATIGWLGLIGGGPTFLGTVIGYRFVSPLLSVLFLTLAAGAIIYVIGEMTKMGGKIGFKELATAGVFVGFIIAFGTDLVLAAAGA